MTEDELYRELQRHLDRAPVPFPATASGVEIRILKRMFTPEEARLALALSMIPEGAATIHRRVRRETTLEQVRKTLDRMADRGLIGRLPGRKPRYAKAPFMIGFYETQVDRLNVPLERDFHQYLGEGFAEALHSGRTPQMRTVPINRRIPVPDRPIGRYDDMAEFVRRSKGPFGVINCICKQGKDLMSQPCRTTTTRRHCLTFGFVTRMFLDWGVARQVGRDDMLAFLQQAEREGLVLQPENTQKPLYVCCCCGCCCGILTTAKRFPRPVDFFSTNYHAEIDAAACQECDTCEGRCQMQAVTRDGGPPTVDRSRCIGCGLCVSTCPSGALRLVANEREKVPPVHTMTLYTRLFRERYGALAVAAVVGRRMLGMKT